MERLKEVLLLEQVSANKERVVIPEVGDFFILTPKAGQTINFEEVIDKEHYTGPTEFAFVVASSVYGPLRRELPQVERWSQDSLPREISLLQFEDRYRQRMISYLSQISQATHFYYLESDRLEKTQLEKTQDEYRRRAVEKDRRFWQEHYRKVAGWIFQDLRHEAVLDNKTEVLPIIRAGKQLAAIGGIKPERSINEKRFRIVGQDDILCSGITADSFDSLDQSLSGKTIVPLEVIAASGSTLNTLLFALESKGVRPGKVKVVALVGVQQGVEVYLKVVRHLGVQTEINLAGLGYSLDQRWYAVASNTDELSQRIQTSLGKPVGQIQLVGDAGDILSLE